MASFSINIRASETSNQLLDACVHPDLVIQAVIVAIVEALHGLENKARGREGCHLYKLRRIDS